MVFPKICLNCGAEGEILCGFCRESLVFSAPSCPVCGKRNFDGVLSDLCAERSSLRRFLAPFSYREGLVRELIHAYKYEGVRELKTPFAEEILKLIKFYDIKVPSAAVLVPVPLHRSRQRERGFNQAGLLAEELGKRLNLEVIPLLKRARATEQQIEMKDYRARRENVARAFTLTNTASSAGRAIILVDDVSASGATLFECARVLREAGARTVWAVAVAKG